METEPEAEPSAESAQSQPASSLVTGLRSFGRVYRHLNEVLIDRDVEIRLALMALASGQHLLLLGPPGTGKSMLARLVGRALGEDAAFFELLLTRFTDPSEVFGPIDIKSFVEDGKYQRKVEGYLPTVPCAFLDEIWKASSAILNSLLTIVNERVFDNGGQRQPVPLRTLFSASNELPQDDSLQALYDRFLLRREVRPVSDPVALLAEPKDLEIPQFECLDEVVERCRRVSLSDEMKAAMFEIKKRLAADEAIVVGDRRFQQSASLVRASSILDGRTRAEPRDLLVLAHCWWSTPDQHKVVERIVNEQASTLAPSSPPPRPSPTPKKSGGSGGSSLPTPRPPSLYQPVGDAFWSQTLHRVKQLTGAAVGQRGMTTNMVSSLVGDTALHNDIHRCLTSLEAQDPNRAEESFLFVSIKQRLFDMRQWLGPKT